MELKAKQKGDIEKINKFTGYQLPNKFKIVGLVIIIVSFLSIVTSLDTYILEEKFYDLFKRVALSGTILGLLIISISKEKIEDELMTKIRTQSYNYAVISAVLLYLTFPFINYIFMSVFSTMPKIEGGKDISVLGFLLFTQILTFRKLKRAYNEE
jgi:L-asparagine transporter-like permease